MDKATKTKKLEALINNFQNSRYGILLSFQGLNVSELTDFRRKLKTTGSELEVVKNSLATIAAKQTGKQFLIPYFQGPTAIAFCRNSPQKMAQTILDSLKDNEKLRFKIAFSSTEIMDLNSLEELSKLPPREVLLSKIIGSLASPISSFLNVLNGNIRKMLYVLEAIKNKKAG